MTSTDTTDLSRRTLLAALGGVGTSALAGCSFTDREPDGETTTTDPDAARRLAERFAPTLYFDRAEPWLPTDPRPYASEQDGESIVDGFDALDGYHEQYAASGEPPNPTVFYNAVEYDDSPLAVVQFWMYSAFDQFSTNFHWHDWEVLHVFVDTDTGRPQLYVASSHSRKVPNNEFLDPEPEMVPRLLSELGSHSSALSVNDEPDGFQRLPGADLLADITNSAITSIEALSELPLAYGLPRDEGARLPYVVPEYEGAPVYEHERLPNVDRDALVPDELTVRSFDALASPPTDLPERSTGVVFRYSGREGAPGNASTATSSEGANPDLESATDDTYDLVPTSEIEHLTDFTGPQLSFEFAVPQAAEDAIAGHISTTGAPWGQPRYENPAADITDSNHRAALAERYDAIGAAAPINTVVARVTEAVTTDDAPDQEGLTTADATVEAVALLESDPVAVPTFEGVAVVRDVPAGDHRFTVNAPGQAPHSERLSVGDSESDATATSGGSETASDVTTTDTSTSEESPTTVDEQTAPASPKTAESTTAESTTAESTTAESTTPGETALSTTTGAPTSSADQRVATAGIDGEIPLVAREDARKLEVDASGTDADLTDLAVEDDFAGRLYDAPLDGSDAVYVHRGGAYTTEVRDADGALGAFRVNPDPDASGALRIDRPETGKASLAAFLASIAAETRDELAALLDGELSTSLDGGGVQNALGGLLRAFDAIVEAASRAAERARAGERGNADQQLQAVETGLERVLDRIEAAGDTVPEPLTNAARNRIAQANRRVTQAQQSEKLS